MWVPSLVLLFVLTVLMYLIYSGLFAHIDVEAKAPKYDDICMAYKTGTGPYKNVGALFTETFALLPDK